MKVFVAFVACFWLCLVVVTFSLAGQPVVSQLLVTDVSPRSFSVIWIASEPSTCTLRVFDQDKKELTGLEIISESASHPPAEDLGVMKVRVVGLKPDTSYYIKTETTPKANGKATIYPVDPMLVQTEKSTFPVNNRVLVQKIYYGKGVPGNGSLLILSVAGCSHPVTGWVGGSTRPPSPYALIDLNNLYSGLTHRTLQVIGGERMTVVGYGGTRGFDYYISKVPVPTQKTIVELTPPVVLSSQ